MLTIKFLSENKTGNPGFLAEHGLSIYIETPEMKLLFDTGAGDVLFRNADKLEVDLESVDAVVLSHGHYDHTQGVPAFCEVNHKARIYVHQKAFERVYGIEKGKLEEEHCGIQWTISQFDDIRSRLTLTKDRKDLTENIVISGTIPDQEGYPPTEKFYIKEENGNLKVDSMEHEQLLIIRDRDEERKRKGIYVFSGCSHKGVVPCLRYAKELFPGERILGFIGGMHLYNASKELREKVLNQVVQEEMDIIIPVHCTGMNAICELKQLVGEKCAIAGTGDTFEF